MRKMILLLTLVAAVAAALAAGASADYGPGTQYQVEISANNVHFGNFWYWAALGPNQESDYQNTDCIHTAAGGNPNAGPNGAAHTSGSLSSWSDSNGTLRMNGVSIVGGAAIGDFIVSDAPHSNRLDIYIEWVAPGAPLPFQAGDTLTWQGPQTQVTVAP
jgi:hypothetical protein